MGKQFVDFLKRVEIEGMIGISKTYSLYLITFQYTNQKGTRKRYPNVAQE